MRTSYLPVELRIVNVRGNRSALLYVRGPRERMLVLGAHDHADTFDRCRTRMLELTWYPSRDAALSPRRQRRRERDVRGLPCVAFTSMSVSPGMRELLVGVRERRSY